MPTLTQALYKVYVSSVSYYSGKLEAYLRYKGIAHERIEINAEMLRKEILPAVGVMKVPVAQCPDGAWLKDTTPMIRWLDQQHPQAGVYPPDPAAQFLALLVEDYADEWLWRPAMHYRWSFPDSHNLVRARLGRELSAGTFHPAWLLGWWMRWRQYFVFVRGDGVRASNRAAVEAVYHRTLVELTALLEGRPYLLGERPSIVDFAFFASMFRHFALDPAPAQIMLNKAAPVYAWVARLWNARADDQMTAAGFSDFSEPAWEPIFENIAREYLPYLDQNAQAYQAGAKRFDALVDGVTYPRMPVVRYRVGCREQLMNEYAGLSADAQKTVRDRLERSGVGTWLDVAKPIPAGLDEEFVMPLTRRYPKARGLYGAKVFAGTPWDLPKPPLDR